MENPLKNALNIQRVVLISDCHPRLNCYISLTPFLESFAFRKLYIKTGRGIFKDCKESMPPLSNNYYKININKQIEEEESKWCDVFINNKFVT